jgi:hypothetical protein
VVAGAALFAGSSGLAGLAVSTKTAIAATNAPMRQPITPEFNLSILKSTPPKELFGTTRTRPPAAAKKGPPL